MSNPEWGSDVPISMPEPLDDPGRVPMFGFVFTDKGLFHDLNRDDHEALSQPGFAPYDFPDLPRESG